MTSVEKLCLIINSNKHNRVGVLTVLFKSVECVLRDDEDDENTKD